MDNLYEIASAAYQQLFPTVERFVSTGELAKGRRVKPTLIASAGGEAPYVLKDVVPQEFIETRDKLADLGADWTAIVAQSTFFPNQAAIAEADKRGEDVPDEQRSAHEAVVFEIRVADVLFVGSCRIGADKRSLHKAELVHPAGNRSVLLPVWEH
jgi:hypothetical protein